VDTNSSSKYFVKIQIAATRNSNPKEFLLSRLQFELLFFSIPVIFLWGVVSTLILVKTLYHDRPTTALEKGPLPTRAGHVQVVETVDSPRVVQEIPTNKPIAAELKEDKSIAAELKEEEITPKSLEALTKDAEAPVAKVSLPGQQLSQISRPLIKELATRSFRVDDIFDVDISISKKSNAPSYAMTIAMTNLMSETESGRYWVSALATTDTGKKVWLTPMPEVKINSSGQAEQPKRGWAYAFRHFRKNSLELRNVKMKIVRFEEVMMGFERDGHSPAIAKVQLIAR